MIELNNDLLNKYIDNDLDKETMMMIKTRLQSSTKDMIRYKALFSIHNELQKMPVEEVSNDFTSNLMLKIQRSLKSKREQNFFIVSVLSLFFLTCIGIVGYLLSNYIFVPESNSSDVILQLTEHFENFISLLSNFFSKGNISIIGSVFSFILLVSGYYFYDSLKHKRVNR